MGVGRPGGSGRGYGNSGLRTPGRRFGGEKLEAAIRVETGYRRSLVNRSTDRFRIEFVQSAIYRLATGRAASFRLADIAVSPLGLKSLSDRQSAAMDILAGMTALLPAFATLVLADNGDRAGLGHLLSHLPGHLLATADRPRMPFDIRFDKLADNDLLQLATTFTGLSRTTALSGARSGKAALAAYLNDRMAGISV